MKRLTIHEEAATEVEEAIAYYEAERAGFGRKFREDLELAFARIRQMPEASAPIDTQGTRKLRCRRFPYTIYYAWPWKTRFG